MSQLDLVISVDTAVAHMAGALIARPGLLLPHNADFRWLKDRSDSTMVSDYASFSST